MNGRENSSGLKHLYLRGEAMYQKIAATCSELASLIPGNAAFFFPSYQLRDSIANHLRSSKKLFFEKGNIERGRGEGPP